MTTINLLNTAVITHRSAVNSDDSDVPAIGSGQDLTGFQAVLVDIVLGGTNPEWDITPCFGDSTINAYTKGTKRHVAENSHFKVEVNGCTDFYVLCDGSSGTSPTITVYLRGLIERG